MTKNCEYLMPKADVIQFKTGIEILMDLPGVESKDIEIDLSERMLTIVAPASSRNDGGISSQELGLGVFRRSFYLSDELDFEKIDASCKDGVLCLTIPMAQKIEPRKIQVSVN